MKNVTSPRTLLTVHEGTSVTFLSPTEDKAVNELSLLRPVHILDREGLSRKRDGEAVELSPSERGVSAPTLAESIPLWFEWVKKSSEPGHHVAVVLIDDEIGLKAVLQNLKILARWDIGSNRNASFVLFQNLRDEDVRFRITSFRRELQRSKRFKGNTILLFDDERVKVWESSDPHVSGCEVECWLRRIKGCLDQNNAEESVSPHSD